MAGTASRWVLGFTLLFGLGPAAWILRDAAQVAAGYAAKQGCSGVFVSGLSSDFILTNDIYPRLAVLGPLRRTLKVTVAAPEAMTRAEILGTEAEARFAPGTGCRLLPSGHPAKTGGPSPGARTAGTSTAAPHEQAGSEEIRAFENTQRSPILTRAFAEPKGGGRRTLAVLASRGGEKLLEGYAAPVTATTPLQGWSMNKSLLVTWIGIQVGRGRLDLDDSLRPALPDPEIADALSSDLKLGHLLHMESGLAFSEIYGPGSDVTRMLYRTPAMWTVPAGSRQAHAPGTHFHYSSGDTVLAAAVWQRSLEQPYPVWLRAHFAKPLGIQSLVAEADEAGFQVASSYAYMTARDWLRVGQLWLDAWHGRSPLLSQTWLRESVRPRGSSTDGRYGRGFWLNTGARAFPGLPENLFYASGNAGQYVIVIPEQELVVVRLGLSDGHRAAGVADWLVDFYRQTIGHGHGDSAHGADAG